ncbi:MAG TPA: alpha-glucan family phosphorylase [Candidatus Limnocylindrales bacterium]|nr:alpha-glucan family phosphorylase [Candidatus Limnocylindrales bacterium]
MPDIPTLPAAALRLPPRLEGLRRLAYDYYWSWHPELRVLFSRIDPAGWARYRNPIPVLQVHRDWTPQLDDPDFMAEFETQLAAYDAYVADGAGHWFERHHAGKLPGPVAYFCAEYGLHESLGTYSGGLGVLAGDHCKAASDMALPFVAVGLFYRRGYFRQAIDADGHQEHGYPDYDPARLPLLRVADADGTPLHVPVQLPGRTVWCAVWLASVGRVPLLLLDTDIPDNADADRPITHILYVRGREMRLHQEIVLGVGGVRALRALGIEPSAWHLNEGHSAFMLVERTRELTAGGAALDEALETVRRDAVFTIHTPVSAGNERFAADLVRRLAAPLIEGSGVEMERILELGRGTDGDPAWFDMTALSLRLTTGANAVSRLHAETANATWDGVPERPILAVTNGIHTPSWLGRPVRALLEGVGADLDRLEDDAPADRFWERIVSIPDRQLWEAHQRQKLELGFFARGRLRNQLARHGEAPETLAGLAEALDPGILTIGFARRFATYKRAALLFADEERLARLIWHAERPIQVVFAGKAHPADRPGQKVIQEIFGKSRSDRFRGRVFILEDYDIRVGRFLVQGVDVWLNNPRRPLEASGTSGMKAAANGIVNLSVLDGWWDEGYDGQNGWAIGGREQEADEGAQDWADAQDLYRLLEDEVTPLYYERDDEGLPSRWIALMKRSMASALWRFSTARMLEEYVEQLYLPAAASSMAGASRRAPLPRHERPVHAVAIGAASETPTAGDV